MRSPILAGLEDVHARFSEDRGGEVATYIPELGLADPEWFGIARSGVAGGIFAVLPGQLGVCVFSPRLDEHGNNVRGNATLMVLDTDTFDRLGDGNPRLNSLLLKNMLASAYESVARMSREVAAIVAR